MNVTEQMYHLPLLPGYSANSNIRSSVPAKSKSILSRLSEAEENGYQGQYFTSQPVKSSSLRDGYISSTSPVQTRKPFSSPAQTPASEVDEPAAESEVEPPTAESEVEPPTPYSDAAELQPVLPLNPTNAPDEDVAEVVFFDYGVIVFFGLEEGQERSILEDVENAGIMKRKIVDDDWEIEECHFAVSTTPNKKVRGSDLLDLVA